MKRILFVLLLSVTCAFSQVHPPKSFINAIHQVESSGRLGAIKGDGGKALGPLQIHRICWLDAVEWDKLKGNKLKLANGSYADCASLPYSIKVMTAYLNRYCRQALIDSNYEVMARTWNGGPNGKNKKATEVYWDKVKKHLTK